jgi:beta-glucosidase
VRKSLVLLKNEANTLPLSRDIRHLALAGAAADSVGLQCGGWTVEWLGGAGNITQGTTLLQAIRQAKSPETNLSYHESGHFVAEFEAEVGVVCLHEPPYAEGVGDRADLNLNEDDIALLKRMRSRCRCLVVIIFSGRPLVITDQLPLAEAWIAAWLPGSEGQGIADVLFGDARPSGRLPYRWPKSLRQVELAGQVEHAGQNALAADNEKPLFPYGYGLTF